MVVSSLQPTPLNLGVLDIVQPEPQFDTGSSLCDNHTNADGSGNRHETRKELAQPMLTFVEFVECSTKSSKSCLRGNQSRWFPG